ncbi:MAG TPA: alpha/beta hydrolase [Planctomicrobium sp.]|nr:alpha/beta hydrolase [Planctomicrobium sp.]
MIRSHRLPCMMVLYCLALLITKNLQAETPTADHLFPNLPYRTDDETLDDYARTQCRIDLSIPPGKKDFPTVIWFHGGGLTDGKKSVPKPLLNQGLGVAAVEYRFSPHVPVTTCIDDAAAATAWIFREIDKYGGSPNKIIISGASAGGYLSLMVSLDPKWLAKYNINPNQLAGIATFTGQTITHMASRAERQIPKTQPLVDELAPLYHVRKDAPPILLMTGDRELEMLGRYEENAYLYRMLKVVGHPDVTLIEFPGFNHSMSAPAYPHLLKFVERVTK